MSSALHNIFSGVSLFSQYCLYLSFRSQIFYDVDLSFIDLNKQF
jgi:hypothetical protein